MTELIRYRRWIILAVLLFIGLSLGFFSDSLSPLKQELQTLLMANSYDYSFIIASGALPGLLLMSGFLGGVFLDKYGLARSVLLFGIIMLFGSFWVAYAVSKFFKEGTYLYQLFDSFWNACTPGVKLMAFGFFIYGIGSQVIRVIISQIIAIWFKGREVATALTLRSASSRIGGAIALVFGPHLYEKYGWKVPLWFSFGVVGLSFVLLIGYLFYMRKVKAPAVKKKKKKKFNLKMVKTLFTNKQFIFLSSLQLIYSAFFFPMVAFGPDMLRNYFGYDLDESGQLISALLILIAVLAPISGFIADKKKRPRLHLFFGGALCSLALLLTVFKLLPSIVMLIIVAIGAALLVSGIQALIPILVRDELLGTAFGFFSTLKNIAIWLSTLLIGHILKVFNDMEKVDYKLDYRPVIIVLFIFSLVGVLLSLFILFSRSMKVEK